MADPQELRERIVGALGAVVAVALVIGVILGVLTYTAVHLTGLDHGSPPAGSTAAAHHSSAQPAAVDVHTSTASPTPTPSPTHASQSRTRHAKKQAHKSRHKKNKRHHHRAHHPSRLTLTASPQRVSPMGRINLHGRFPGHGGTSLAVQRLEGGHWNRFPVSATVRGGRYATWVASGRHGPNKFRVVGAGHVSRTVVVVIG